MKLTHYAFALIIILSITLYGTIEYYEYRLIKERLGVIDGIKAKYTKHYPSGQKRGCPKSQKQNFTTKYYFVYFQKNLHLIRFYNLIRCNSEILFLDTNAKNTFRTASFVLKNLIFFSS
jgi:hypothetical protein